MKSCTAETASQNLAAIALAGVLILGGCKTPPATHPEPTVPITTLSLTTTHATFKPGVAATSGQTGWWATSWTNTEGQGFKGAPANVPSQTILVRHDFYTVCYDLERRIPLWGAYTVDKSQKAVAASKERGDKKPGFSSPSRFASEPLLESAAVKLGLSPATHDDYDDSIDSRYPVDPSLTARAASAKDAIIQRGHLVPNNAMKCTGDPKTGQQSMRDCFSIANILPQSNAFNHPTWNKLENAILDWGDHYDRAWVICGPVMLSTPPVRMVARTNREDRNIIVPDAMFCVVIVKDEGKLRTAAFILPNKPENFSYTDYAKSVDEVEAVTKLNFFPELGEPANVEKESGKWILGL